MKSFIVFMTTLLIILFKGYGQDEITLHLEGKWPYGSSYTMAISDTIGFYPCGEVLITLNLTDPENPVILKKELYHDIVTDVLITGDLLFVAFKNQLSIRSFNGGPHTIQLSNLEVTNRIIDLARIRDLLFVVEYAKITLFDISDPGNPRFLSDLKTENTIRNLSFNGTYAYGGSYDNWLAMFDFSDSLNLQFHPYFFRENDFISHAIWRDSFLYVSESRNDSLHIYTIENPLLPEIVNSIYMKGMYGISFHHEIAIISGQGHGIKIYDFSNPENPQFVKSISKWSEEVHLNPPYLFNQSDDGRIDVYDISDEANILYIGLFAFGSRNQGFDLDEKYAYIVQAQRGIAIVDVRQELGPYEIGIIPITDDYLYSVTIFENYCFVGGRKLYIYDISDPLSPVSISEYTNNDRIRQIQISHPYVFMNQGRDGIQILDITEINNPVEVGSFKDVKEVDVIQVVGNTLYFSDDLEKLIILDVTDKATPVVMDSFIMKHITGMALEDSYLYLSRRSTGFTILDIRDPRNPDSLYSSPYAYAFDVAVRGDTLYLLDLNSGPRVYDVSDKTMAEQLGSYYYKGSLNSLLPKDEYLYLLDTERGLQILKMERQQTVAVRNEQHRLNPIWIYPNPAQSRCTIDLTSSPEENSNLVLYDVTGNQVYWQKWPNSSLSLELSVASLKAGIYFMKIGNAPNQRRGKLFVLK